MKTSVDLPPSRRRVLHESRRLSNADIEAVILMALDDAAREGLADVSEERFIRAAADYFPSRDTELLEYMELLAVFEASS